MSDETFYATLFGGEMRKRTSLLTIEIDYTNWKGERRVRRIIPQEIRFVATDYHREEQWVMKAFDLEKNALRTFAMSDIHSWKQIVPQSAVDTKMPSEYANIPLLGITLRQTVTAPETHVDIHPFVFQKLLNSLAAADRGPIDIFMNSEPPTRPGTPMLSPEVVKEIQKLQAAR